MLSRGRCGWAEGREGGKAPIRQPRSVRTSGTADRLDHTRKRHVLPKQEAAVASNGSDSHFCHAL